MLPRLDELAMQADVLIRANRGAYETAYVDLRDELVKWIESRWPLEPRSR